MLSGLRLIFSNCFTKMNWLVFSVKECWKNASFQINILQLWLFLILMWIGRRFSNAVEARIWSCYIFSKYFSVWSKVIINGDHDIKYRSRLIAKDDVTVSLFRPLFPDSQILCVENMHKSLTEWLTGWNCLSFFNKRKI